MTPFFPGTKVTANGREWVVPSLTTGDVIRLDEDGHHKRTSEAKGLAALVRVELEAITPALRRNYPDITDADLMAFSPVELAALYGAVWRATMGVPDEGARPEAESPAASN